VFRGQTPLAHFENTHTAIVAFLVFCASPQALAGPPLSIDDPGVLDPWHWEIIGATTLTSDSDGDYWQAPLLDISLGVIEDYVQVGFVYPYAHADSGNGRSQSDFGNAEFGVKWRFLKRDRLQMAFAPYHVFGVSTGTAAKGIGDDSDAAVLPINAEYSINDRWSLNGEVSYVSVDDGNNEWGTVPPSRLHPTIGGLCSPNLPAQPILISTMIFWSYELASTQR
jgi:hypothetical protein